MFAGEVPEGPMGEVHTFRPRSAGEARSAVAGVVNGLPGSLVDDLKLLVSELVTNSLRHGRLRPTDGVEVVVRLHRAKVRVEVSDPGRGDDVPRRRSPSEDGGWGLHIVDGIADRWGIETRPTRVWFELAVPQRAS